MAKAAWAGFINIRLRDEHKEVIKKRATHKDADKYAMEGIEQLVDDGYSVSIGPDAENGSMIATITGKDTECANPGLAMSQRHSQPKVALFAALYAHFDLAQGQSWENAVETNEYWDW